MNINHYIIQIFTAASKTVHGLAKNQKKYIYQRNIRLAERFGFTLCTKNRAKNSFQEVERKQLFRT